MHYSDACWLAAFGDPKCPVAAEVSIERGYASASPAWSCPSASAFCAQAANTQVLFTYKADAAASRPYLWGIPNISLPFSMCYQSSLLDTIRILKKSKL